MVSENSSSNAQGEALKIIFSILGSKPNWTGMSLDISSAFLYARLRSSKPIVIYPPCSTGETRHPGSRHGPKGPNTESSVIWVAGIAGGLGARER